MQNIWSEGTLIPTLGNRKHSKVVWDREREITCEGERPEGHDTRSLKERGSMMLLLVSFLFSMAMAMVNDS